VIETKNDFFIQFIKSRPELEAKVREAANGDNTKKFFAASAVDTALHSASGEERTCLMRLEGRIEWNVILGALRDPAPIGGIPRDSHRRDLDGRRAQIASEVRKMVAEAERWNRQHPNDEPIVIDVNFEKDVEAAKWPL
jgi:hypothetical protein